MTSSVSTRLVLWLVTPLILLALLGGLIDYFINDAPMLASSERRLTDTANYLSAGLRVQDGQVALVSAPDETQTLEEISVIYVVRDARDHIVAGDAKIPFVTVNEINHPVHSILPVNGRNMRALTYCVETTVGPVTITVVDALSIVEASVRSRFLTMLLWDFVQLAITLVLVWFGIQLGLRPLRNLGTQIADRSPQDLRSVPEASVPKDMLPLTNAVNRLFRRVSNASEAQQKFIADTAHQLRTPITGIAAQLDLLTNEPQSQPIMQRLVALQEAIRQLAHSTNQLLNLARAETATHNVSPGNSRVDLKNIADEVVARFVDRAVLADIDLGVESHTAHVTANPSLIDDLLSNLVDNALKYTAASGVVTVSTGIKNDRPFLEVTDNGRGIPESERKRVLQRFYRSPDSPSHGTGLGLAIVEEIANLYGASLSIGTGHNEQGTCVRVQFPVSKSA